MALLGINRSPRIFSPWIRLSSTTPLRKYEKLVADGVLKRDPKQAHIASLFDDLHERCQRVEVVTIPLPGKGSMFPFFGASSSPDPVPMSRAARAASEGLYVYGGVGAGKTMIMDMFFEGAPVEKKRRTHFHKFMLDVHQRIHDWNRKNTGDPMLAVGQQIARESSLLCFDEFQVHDIADAMILKRLFQVIFDAGVMVVATSNRPPKDLYADGLNRVHFLPFISLLEQRVKVASISGKDYRQQLMGLKGIFNFPLGAQADIQLDKWFNKWTKEVPKSLEIDVMMGRRLPVPVAADGAAWFKFNDLCGRPLGAADYIAIAKNFHTVVLEGIPVMTPIQINEARRFITLIDVLYEDNIRVVISAAADVDKLFDMNAEDYVVRDGRADSDTPGDHPDMAMDKDHLQFMSIHTIENTAGEEAKMDRATHVKPEHTVSKSAANVAFTQTASASELAKKKIVSAAELGATKDIIFAYGRTTSRLREMQSEEYMAMHSKRHLP